LRSDAEDEFGGIFDGMGCISHGSFLHEYDSGSRLQQLVRYIDCGTGIHRVSIGANLTRKFARDGRSSNHNLDIQASISDRLYSVAHRRHCSSEQR